MPKAYIIYNPLAGEGQNEENVRLLEIVMDDEQEYFDMTHITNYAAFIGSMDKEDYLVIAGGDGTLNRFVNDTAGIGIEQEIYYFPTGSGNDFARDVGKNVFNYPFPVTQYLKELPSVTVKGKTYHFINGVGFGIDGYCCQVGDKLKEKQRKKVNYASVAVKGLLFHFKPRNAKVTVDGREYTYKKVWIAPTMLGRYYGGGMMAAPDQNRENKEKKLSLVVFHGAGRLRTLCVFPKLFKGTHVKKKKLLAVHTGRNIRVEFDRPTPLQIDGETIQDVTEYRAVYGLNKQGR
ncbi:MAG: diacylglycerol kinase family protein [Oscillospiraceae bacterium]|nr:diacylglycerol kinase family protein [Oscillospiraceae bacterium]